MEAEETAETLTLPSSNPNPNPNPLAGFSLQQPPPSPLLPTLPLDLITEIICRLPVKSLMKFRCVCKPWNSLISADRKFSMKHLRCMSSTMNHNLIQKSENNQSDFSLYPLRTIFNGCTDDDAEEIKFPLRSGNYFYNGIDIVASCDGILCLAWPCSGSIVILWNPSIRKYNISPPLKHFHTGYGFGYDNITDNYKLVAVTDIFKTQTQVKVHTLGTNSWRLIDDEFPCFGDLSIGSGKFVSGTINWLVFICDSTLWSIVSLDLGTESYQEILQPDYGKETVERVTTLGVLRDCLSLIRGQDIWLMKEYGNRDSWTKFATVPHLGFRYYHEDVLYISEDDQVLHELALKLVVYNSINDTLKSLNIKTKAMIYVESLISPCS